MGYILFSGGNKHDHVGPIGGHGGHGSSECCEVSASERIPVLRYMKDPVQNLEELYSRFPLGGEPGWFALVLSERQFAFWNVLTRTWEYPVVKEKSVFAGLGVDPLTMKEGDMLIWDGTKFVPMTLSVWNREEF